MANEYSSKATDLKERFEDALSDLTAAINIVEFAVEEGHVGEDVDDLGGQLVLPVKLLLEDSLDKFNTFNRALEDPPAQVPAGDQDTVPPSIDKLQSDATLPLLAALAIANFADAYDCEGAGRIMFPVKKLLNESNRKFSELEMALLHLRRSTEEASADV